MSEHAVYYPAPGNPDFLAAYIGNKRAGHPMKGWKIHVSAYPYNAQDVANLVLPILCACKIWHKYIKSAMHLSRMPGGQRGKFITIYTRDVDEKSVGSESQSLVGEISQAIVAGDLSGPEIVNEKKLGEMIYARYSFDYTRPDG
ncbi:MAG TPA: hypothetical protein VFL63_00955 [Rhodanobacteraceae bacterium]|nr:hypothetical protein [Rhodanobacteraceae bacterium]